MNTKKRMLALVLCLALVILPCLSAVGGSAAIAYADAEEAAAEGPSSAESSQPAASEETAGGAEEADMPEERVFGGSPWQISIVAGNLPLQRPEVKDDLYTYFNYDYLEEHQDDPTSTMDEYADDIISAVLSLMEDESVSGHDVEQLRIFHRQALDQDTLKEQGITELRPYLDRIASVSTLEELNTLLVSKDFPFSPFLLATLIVLDTRTQTIVALNPNFLLSDALIVGGMYYQNSDDPDMQEFMNTVIELERLGLIPDFSLLGMGEEEVGEMVRTLADFEIAYGQYLEAPGTVNNMAFGEYADLTYSNVATFEELAERFPNLPLQGILTKLGKDGSPQYSVPLECFGALNELWTEENLETLKLMAMAKLFDETRPYRDPSAANAYTFEQYGDIIPVANADGFAYTACDSMDTFSHLLAKLYVDLFLGDRAVERLTALSRNLIDAYRELVSETEWLEEESRARIMEKLEHMQLSILAPEENYFDYSGLELTPSEEGGTLLGNYLKLKQYRYDRERELVGQSAIPDAVFYCVQPTMQNAFYNQIDNSINILPGFINRSNYSDDMDDCTLYAVLGYVIAHEISHGFDNVGAQFGAYGQDEAVFVGNDEQEFVAKTERLAAYFDSIEITEGVTVNGKNVLAEAAADLSGLQAALYAAENADAFDYMEFFDALALEWAQVIDEPTFRVHLIDSHPISILRVNVSAQMLDEIYEDFDIREGDGMYLAPEERIVIWGPNAA